MSRSGSENKAMREQKRKGSPKVNFQYQLTMAVRPIAAVVIYDAFCQKKSMLQCYSVNKAT